MLQVRLVLCFCACLPAFAGAEIVLEAPPPVPAPAAPPPAAVPAPGVVRREVPVAEEVAPAPPPRESAGPFSDRIKLKDGSERVGDFSGASEAGVGLRRRAFPRPVVFPWDQVVRIELNQTVPKAGVSEPHLVAFTCGDALPGQVVELTGDRLVVATWFAGKVEAKVAAVQQLGIPEPKPMDPEEAQRLALKALQEARTPQDRNRAMARYEATHRMVRPAKPAPPPEKPVPGMRLVILANGDKLQCSKFAIRDGKAQVETAAGPLEIPAARVRSCVWSQEAKMPPVPPPGTRTVRFNGPLGGKLQLRLDSIADGKLVGTHDVLGKLEIALDAVAAIE